MTLKQLSVYNQETEPETLSISTGSQLFNPIPAEPRYVFANSVDPSVSF